MPPTAEHARSTGFDRVLLHDGVPKVDQESDYISWRKGADPQAAEFYHRAVVANPEPGKNPYKACIRDEYHETTWVGEKTRAELRDLASRDQPFFLFSSFFQPHSPFYVPEPFDSMYDDVEFPLARVVGRCLSTLEQDHHALVARDQVQQGADQEDDDAAMRDQEPRVMQFERPTHERRGEHVHRPARAHLHCRAAA